MTQLAPGSVLAATLITDRPDGLFPTVVVDEQGVALGLVYSNTESISEAVDTGKGVYYSRSRYFFRHAIIFELLSYLAAENPFGARERPAETPKNSSELKSTAIEMR